MASNRVYICFYVLTSPILIAGGVFELSKRSKIQLLLKLRLGNVVCELLASGKAATAFLHLHTSSLLFRKLALQMSRTKCLSPHAQ